ncbi:ABC transporter permease [Oscillospiraceae bacterium OttesenSCG-928-F05]|nr:ABC transporter permease [Oscillospiraceae bacterium OttesenSCG-928-F05]
MNIGQALKMAMKSIGGNKGRSFLTMLGIIIGTAAVITLVTIIQGFQRQVADEFARMGTNQVSIYNWSGKNITNDLQNFAMTLDSEDFDGFTPNYQTRKTIRYKDKSCEPQVYMVSHQYSHCMDYTLALGRDLSYMDAQLLNRVCILGAKVKYDLFNYINPVGQTITINGTDFTVVGVYEAKEDVTLEYNWYDNMVVIPYSLVQRVERSQNIYISEYTVKAKDSAATNRLVTELDDFMKRRVGEGQYHVYSANNYMEENNQVLAIFGLVLTGIAAISLLVGGIGIMNIMLVTVTERTREIGIRKAIGAKRQSIIVQFLIEASVLSAFGGVLGILVGSFFALLGGKAILNLIAYPTPGTILVAFGVSILFGIVFGVYPAAKASKLQPVDALRSE